MFKLVRVLKLDYADNRYIFLRKFYKFIFFSGHSKNIRPT